jgi:tetratricopeptide (TPR) repeat protein
VTRLVKVSVVVATLVMVGFAASVIGAYLWAGHHYRQAEHDLAKRDFAAAHAHLQSYLKVHSHDATTHFLAARTARRGGMFDDARRHLEDCEHLHWPRDSIALERMLITVQQGEVAAHEEYLLSCLDSEHEEVPLILEALIEGYFRSFKVEMAAFCVQKFLERQPDNPQGYFWSGQVHDTMELIPDAVLDYGKAIDLDPDFDLARLYLAEDLVRSERGSEALPHFELLRSKHYHERRVQLGLASCLAVMGDLEKAGELLDEWLVEMAPDDPHALQAMTERGKIALSLEQPAEAEKWFRKGLALFPHNREILYHLFLSLEELDRHEEARIFEAQCRDIDNDLRRVEHFKEQLRRNPHDPAPRYEIGVILLRLGRDNDALTWLVSALQEDALYRPALVALADYYEKKGDTVRVKEFRRRAQVNALPLGESPTPPSGKD